LLLLTANIYEIILGVLVIAGLFAVRKYLAKCETCIRFERLVASGEIKPEKKGEENGN